MQNEELLIIELEERLETVDFAAAAAASLCRDGGKVIVQK